jgi:hypothetical protein
MCKNNCTVFLLSFAVFNNNIFYIVCGADGEVSANLSTSGSSAGQVRGPLCSQDCFKYRSEVLIISAHLSKQGSGVKPLVLLFFYLLVRFCFPASV